MFLYFAIISWLGAELFFPVLAQITFTTLAPHTDIAGQNLVGTHLAGAIVGACLTVLHHEGVVCAVLVGLALLGARQQKMYARTYIRTMLALVVLMLSLTVFSEHGITSRMRAYRLQAGGIIDLAPANDPNRIAFERLHRASEKVEAGIILFGIALVVVLTFAESKAHEIRPGTAAIGSA